MEEIAYLSGEKPSPGTGPLRRFLPPLPDGMARAALKHVFPKGEQADTWVLDPFGSAPNLPVEAAHAGWRVLATVNNPVARFLLELTAAAPTRQEFQAALAELGSARKGEERLETHLQSLYLTECTRCHRKVPAEAFLWEQGGEVPLARLYHCPCGEGGEFPTTESDRLHAAILASTTALHRARALERVAPRDDPDRPYAEAALNCYLPRAIYALITIINKLDSLSLTPERRRCLTALVLFACDAANTLWAYPEDRPRPKLLTTPSRFLEHNVWLALERGVDTLASTKTAVPVVNWPRPAPASGVCIFEGALRDLAGRLKNLPIRVVLTAIPRPNQAFWTLSALWAGWLWGQQTASAFKAALRRQRYDWDWHAEALGSVFRHMSHALPLHTLLFGFIAEPEAAYLSATLVALEGAGFDLSGLALRTVHDPIQLFARRRAYEHSPRHRPSPETIRQTLQEYLNQRGEPTTYLHLHAAALQAMAAEQSLACDQNDISILHTPIQKALQSSPFVHYSNAQNPESGLWGLEMWETETIPLPDRVEMVVVRTLQKRPTIPFHELEQTVNEEIGGLFTPSLGLIHQVLNSYAVESNGRWSLRPEDHANARRADLESASVALRSLGQHLGFTVATAGQPGRLTLWQEHDQVVFAFYLLASAVVGTILRQNPYPPTISLLVLPGGRAGLLLYKLRRDPSLMALWNQGWRVLKFRTLRRLAITPPIQLQREGFLQELNSDPLDAPAQMQFW